VDGLTGKMISKIDQFGIPTLSALIEQSDESWEEYILDHSIMDDDASCCEAWESPIVMSYVDGAWRACKVNENGEYGYMRKEIVRQVRTWTMLQGGQEENHVMEYVMEDGTTITYSGLAEYLGEAA